MILVDANLLLYAHDSNSPHHDDARRWLSDQLNGNSRVGLPWQSLIAFVRIATHPRVYANPLSSDEAWTQIEEWLAATPVWIPLPTERHASILGAMVREHDVTGALVSDAELAALAIEHGLELCSVDTDFARFPQLQWHNPLLDS